MCIRDRTYDEQPLGTDLQASSSFAEHSGGPGAPGMPPNSFENTSPKKGASILEISEAKALKAIAKYSVLKAGEEKNKKIFDANILSVSYTHLDVYKRQRRSNGEKQNPLFRNY